MGQPQPQMGGPRQPVAGAPAMSASAVTLDDDEWEYEYDAAETEDLYFTLDLTTHVPDALSRKHIDTAIIYEPRQVNASADKAPNGDVQAENGGPEDGLKSHNTRPFTQHTLQFLDLHSQHPLVKLDEGTYSCYWTTDLGTQFHIAESGDVPNPRHEGAVLDIVGASRSRLIGKPVTLIERQGAKDSQTQGAAASNAINLDDDELSEDETNGASENATPGPSSAPGQPLAIPRENCKNLAAEKQASFLERLSLIKLKKGEDDTVPVYSVKVYKDPDNVDELKKQALAADAAEKRKSKSETATSKSEPPRKRRKRLTAAEKGLIADGTLSGGGRPGRATIAAQIGLQDLTSPSGPSRPRRAARDKPSRVEQYDTMMSGDIAEETPDPMPVPSTHEIQAEANNDAS